MVGLVINVWVLTCVIVQVCILTYVRIIYVRIRMFVTMYVCMYICLYVHTYVYSCHTFPTGMHPHAYLCLHGSVHEYVCMYVVLAVYSTCWAQGDFIQTKQMYIHT